MGAASVKNVIDNDAYGNVLESGAVRFERILPGPIGRVWDFLTESEKRGTWLASGEMELWVGGKVTLNFHNARLSPPGEAVPNWLQPFTGPLTLNGEVTLLDKPHRLGFTWGDAGDGSPASEVVFELKPQGSSVMLALTHRRLTGNREGFMISCGWHTHLGVLIAQVNGDAPPPYWQKFEQVKAVYHRNFPE